MALCVGGNRGRGKGNLCELLELASHLRDEKLFVTQEKDTLNKLFKSLDESSREVHSLNWVLQQQKCITADLIMGSQTVTPEVCCSKFNAWEEAAFIDGYKLLTHNEIKVGKFLKNFRESPKLVALCLFYAQNLGMNCLQQTSRTVMLQLYGGLLLPEDEVLAVSMLTQLLNFHVKSGKVKNPLKFVCKWQTAFGLAYRLLTECLPSSKPFLTVAFHDPTIALLAEDEWFYDVDIEKALSRFSQMELLKRFGQPETDSYKHRVKSYKSRIVDKLTSLVARFIHGMEFSTPVFPRSLAKIIKEACRLFSQMTPQSETSKLGSSRSNCWSGTSGSSLSSGDRNSLFLSESSEDGVSKKTELNGFDPNISLPLDKTACSKGDAINDAKKACLYLVLNTFLCPAICDPEIRGIVFDTPVGDVARHNLMQIAQILQVLALSPYEEEVDLKYKELCGKFDKECLSFLLDSIIHDNNVVDDSGACHHGNILDSVDQPQRSSIPVSPCEFVDLMEIIYGASSSSSPCGDVSLGDDHQHLKDLIASTNLPPMTTLKSCCQKYLVQVQDVSPLPYVPGKTLTSSFSPSTNMKKTNFDDSMFNKSINNSRYSSPIFHHSISKTLSTQSQSQPQQQQQQQQDVLVINLGIYSECPGMLPEQKVQDHEMKSRKQKLQMNSILPGEDGNVKQCNLLISGKRTRFSLSHDTDSIEPNNEGVSEEAVSSHSTDDENNNSIDNNSNDNLSDMAYSANLSGRNTPSIVSGRDTPVSLMSGGLGGAEGGAANSIRRSVGDDDGGETMVIAEVVINSGGSPAGIAGRLVNRGDAVTAGAASNFGEVSTVGGSNVVSVVVSAGRNDLMRKRDVRRDDVTDKFGKFDIKQDIEMEAKSTVSDTWSTDVLASDSEPPPEQNHLDRLEEVVEENAILPPRVGGVGMGAAVSETGISETASDAWSTDVLTSDTSERQADRLLELDQEETCSFSGRSALSFIGFNTTAHDSGLDKTSHTSGKQSLHESHLFSLIVHPNNETLRSEVFDNFSDSSSHKGNLSSFDVFDSSDPRNSVFTRKPNFKKRDFSVYPSPVSTTTAPISGISHNKHNNMGDKLRNNNINNNTSDFFSDGKSNISSSDQFLNPKYFQELSDDSEAASNQNLSNPKFSNNYDESFGFFDPFAPNEVMSLTKSINSSSADNLDVLVPPCNNLLTSSRASSSMTHISDQFSSPALEPFVAMAIDPNSFPGQRNEDSKTGRTEIKKKSGLFGTFRERLSKVNQASKRRAVKSPDEFAQLNPSVLIDFDHVDNVGTARNGQHKQETNSWKYDESINTEKILAKYRKSPIHPSTSNPLAVAPSSSTTPLLDNNQQQQNFLSLPISSSSSSHSTSPLFHQPPLGTWEGDKEITTLGRPHLPSAVDFFADAKKKLRLVLGRVDCSQFKAHEGGNWLRLVEGFPNKTKNPSNKNSGQVVENHVESKVEGVAQTELVMLLKVLLAESIVSDDKVLATQLQEAIRCLAHFESNEIKRLLKSLKDDYKTRSYYIAYLTRCKKSLLASIAFYDKLLSRVKREKSVVSKYLVSVMTRLYLEKQEFQIIKFISEFQKLMLFDEKSDLLEKFLNGHHEDIRNDFSWKDATESQLDEVHLCIERTIMSHIYTHALFPNGDGDVHRDKKMEDHMKSLSRIITPDNKYLKIAPVYHNECPWLAAQKELTMINAFKTPEDKLECVVRCCSTIMTLLSLALSGGSSSSSGGHKGSGDGEGGSPCKGASGGGVPAADDFMPVLIYVIIMSDTSNLLSTIQYVKSYCEKTSSSSEAINGGDTTAICRQRNVFSDGEKLYWWMQFVAAVEFIKTMDYNE